VTPSCHVTCLSLNADVCDDNDYAARAKADYHKKAQEAGVPAITSGGIYPGVSNVMAAHMVSTARREYDTKGHFVGKDGANKADAVEPKKLQYFYYTAGTGDNDIALHAAMKGSLSDIKSKRLVAPPMPEALQADMSEASCLARVTSVALQLS